MDKCQKIRMSALVVLIAIMMVGSRKYRPEQKAKVRRYSFIWIRRIVLLFFIAWATLMSYAYLTLPLTNGQKASGFTFVGIALILVSLALTNKRIRFESKTVAFFLGTMFTFIGAWIPLNNTDESGIALGVITVGFLVLLLLPFIPAVVTFAPYIFRPRDK